MKDNSSKQRYESIIEPSLDFSKVKNLIENFADFSKKFSIERKYPRINQEASEDE